MCVDENGQPDHSSIYVNMKATQDRSGCFAWHTPDCMFDLRKVAKIEFDIDLTSCYEIWAAPLWISPTPWLAPAGTSGEIDFAELCWVTQVRTNFAGGGTQEQWASPSGLNGPKHYSMTFEDSSNLDAGGTVRAQICDLGGANCYDSSYYTNFLSTVSSTKGKAQGSPYRFVSDIWNGYSGDGGWYGCGARNMPSGECQYAIRNIRIHWNPGAQGFNGKCAILNGNGSPSPSPGPSPLPGSLKPCSSESTYTTSKCSSSALGACWSSDPSTPWSCWQTLTELTDSRCQVTPTPSSDPRGQGVMYSGACVLDGMAPSAASSMQEENAFAV